MPIVVSNQPAQLIGNLAQNAGNFATGQAQQQMGLEQARFADSQRHGDEQLQLQRDQMAQQADIAKQHIQATVMAHVLSSMSQQQLEKLREDARQKQVDAQIQGRQSVAGINGSNRTNIAQMNIDSREGIADTRDTTQQRGQDLRTGVAYDKMDQQNDQFGQNYDQRQQGMGIRQQSVDNQQNYQQGRLAQGQDRSTAYGQQQDRLAQQQQLDSIRDEARMLQHTITADPRNHLPETAVARARMNELAKAFKDLSNKFNNRNLAATQPVVSNPGYPQQQMPQMGMYAGDETQAYGGGQQQPVPQSAPMPQPAMQPPPVNPDVIRQLVLEGYTNEEIKAMIRGQ